MTPPAGLSCLRRVHSSPRRYRRHLEKTEAMRVADGDEFACERGERERRRGDEVSARIETMDAWTGRDVGRRRLCRASPQIDP